MNNSNTLTKNKNELNEFYSAREFSVSKVPRISQKTKKERRTSLSYSLTTPPKVYPSSIKIYDIVDKQTVKSIYGFVARIAIDVVAHNYSSDKIREYFAHKPSIRAKKVLEYTNYIKSTDDVFKVLQLGNCKEEFFEAYDGAVDLLAECDEEILTKAFYVAKKRYVSYTNDEVAKSWEKNWDILIQALICSLKIEPIKKISLILSLYDGRNKLSRLIKLALIDAIVDIEIDEDLSKSLLNLFISDERESDELIRQCANEAIESL